MAYINKTFSSLFIYDVWVEQKAIDEKNEFLKSKLIIHFNLIRHYRIFN